MASKQTILYKAENQVRQQLFGGILLAVAGLMVITTFGGLYAGTVNNTALTFNVTSGAFTIVNAPASMAFAAQPFGTPNNITGNEYINGLTVTDYRGTSTTWGVVATATNFNASGNIINSDRLNCYAEAGNITNVANADVTQVANGTNGTLNDTGIVVFNGSNDASGVFQYDDGFINLTVDGTEVTGDYTAVLTFTLS